MVVLSPSFTVLASLSTLALVSMLPMRTDAVALPNTGQQHDDPFAHRTTSSGHKDSSLNGGTSRSPDVNGNDQESSASSVPVIPLPGLSRRQRTEKHVEKRGWDPLNPVLQLSDLWIGTGSPRARHYDDHVDVEGSDDHVHVSHHHHGPVDVEVNGDDDHVHVHRRTPVPEPHHHHHHHDSHDKVVVSGDHDHVDVHRRTPVPEPHHHHHHDSHDKVVVSGDHDHVNVHQRRAPRRHHHHGHHRRAPHSHHHHSHDTVIVKGDDDHVNVHQRDSGISMPLLDKDRSFLVPALQRRNPHHHHAGDTMVISGDHDDVDAHMKRQVSAFEEPEGVPGTIDIMSMIDGSTAQRIASLVLSSAMGNDVVGDPDPFILNASGTNQTQIYMVVLSDDDDASPTSADSSPTATDNGTTSASPASSTDAMSTAGPSQTLAPMSLTNSTAPSNSTSDPSSTPQPSKYRKVALKIPLFDAESATMQAYCATFDPQPEAPSPLTVESCSEGVMAEEHKSQIFAFDPESGTIQPMWYTGGDDSVPNGGEDDNAGDDLGAGDDTDDNGADAVSPSAGNSTTTSDVASAADVDATMARVASLSDDLLDIDSTIQPPAPKLVGNAHAFAAEPTPAYSNPQNVTLMFAPATPELTPQAASEDRQANGPSSSSSASSSATSSTMTSSVTVASTTDSVISSDFVSTTVTFSPASAAAAPSSSVTSDPSASTTSANTTSTSTGSSDMSTPAAPTLR